MHPENLVGWARSIGEELMVLKRGDVQIRLLTAAAVATMAIAAPAAAPDSRRQVFSLGTTDLADAIRAVSRQSGREILFSAEALNGKQAPHLNGPLTADEAVRILLQGSDLTAEYRKDVILIRGRSETSGAVMASPTETGEILVTGSRLRGGGGTTSPLIVATRTQIQLGGHNDLGDYVRSIPQNYGGGQNPTVAGGGAQGGDNNNINGSSNLNLRGLGTDATLTLINGHRVAYDAIGAGTDISAIPLAAIDRIEIVADGSSAIYGSDAVAGVANVILRRDFDGVSTSARVGGATEGGDFQQQYDVVGGGTWTAGGFVVAADFNRSTAVNGGNRAYTHAMDPSSTLFPRLKQYSTVVAGHQDLTGLLALELDAQYSHRTSEIAYPFTATSSVTANGLLSRPTVSTYSVTPTLRISLPATWQMALSGTHGQSKSHLESHTYSGGSEFAVTRIHYDGRIDSTELSAEGPLWRLPGGEMRLAAGAGYRSVELAASSRRTIAATTTTLLNISPTRENFYGFGEVSLPFIGADSGVPLVHRLTVTAAARYENYRRVGDLLTPKLGLVLEPDPSVAIKASWGKSFKAPTLFEQYQATQGTLVRGTGFQNNPGGRPGLLIYGGGRDLQPEKATTWTTSVLAKPFRGASVEIGYFNIRFRHRIVEAIGSTSRAFNNPMFDGLILYNPTQQQVIDALARLNTPLLNASGQALDTANVSAIFDDRLQNIAKQHVEGIDIAAQYEMQLGPKQSLSLTGAASYLRGDRQLSANQPVTTVVGRIFNPPHWRARAGFNWRLSSLSWSGFLNHSDGTDDTVILPAQRVGSFTTVDTTVKLAAGSAHGILHGVELLVSATNLFDQHPPKIRVSDATGIPFDSTNASALGRIVSLTVAKTW
jgi:outer membrane receptor protein involved in Fe transport